MSDETPVEVTRLTMYADDALQTAGMKLALASLATNDKVDEDDDYEAQYKKEQAFASDYLLPAQADDSDDDEEADNEGSNEPFAPGSFFVAAADGVVVGVAAYRAYKTHNVDRDVSDSDDDDDNEDAPVGAEPDLSFGGGKVAQIEYFHVDGAYKGAATKVKEALVRKMLENAAIDPTGWTGLYVQAITGDERDWWKAQGWEELDRKDDKGEVWDLVKKL